MTVFKGIKVLKGDGEPFLDQNELHLKSDFDENFYYFKLPIKFKYNDKYMKALIVVGYFNTGDFLEISHKYDEIIYLYEEFTTKKPPSIDFETIDECEVEYMDTLPEPVIEIMNFISDTIEEKGYIPVML